MAAKKAVAKAAVVKAAPAADQNDGATAPSTGTQETAGIAPAAGADSGNTQGAGSDGDAAKAGDTQSTDAPGNASEGTGDGDSAGAAPGDAAAAATSGQGDGAGSAASDSSVSGESVNALTGVDANAPTSEGANAPGSEEPPADLALLGDQEPTAGSETTQTPPENAPVEPVILGLWSLPQISKFPAILTLTNHTASRFVVLGKGIAVDCSIDMEVTEQQFLKLAKSLVGHVRLDKWDNVRGLQVAHESTD